MTSCVDLGHVGFGRLSQSLTLGSVVNYAMASKKTQAQAASIFELIRNIRKKSRLNDPDHSEVLRPTSVLIELFSQYIPSPALMMVPKNRELICQSIEPSTTNIHNVAMSYLYRLNRYTDNIYKINQRTRCQREVLAYLLESDMSELVKLISKYCDMNKVVPLLGSGKRFPNFVGHIKAFAVDLSHILKAYGPSNEDEIIPADIIRKTIQSLEFKSLSKQGFWENNARPHHRRNVIYRVADVVLADKNQDEVRLQLVYRICTILAANADYKPFRVSFTEYTNRPDFDRFGSQHGIRDWKIVYDPHGYVGGLKGRLREGKGTLIGELIRNGEGHYNVGNFYQYIGDHRGGKRDGTGRLIQKTNPKLQYGKTPALAERRLMSVYSGEMKGNRPCGRGFNIINGVFNFGSLSSSHGGPLWTGYGTKIFLPTPSKKHDRHIQYVRKFTGEWKNDRLISLDRIHKYHPSGKLILDIVFKNNMPYFRHVSSPITLPNGECIINEQDLAEMTFRGVLRDGKPHGKIDFKFASGDVTIAYSGSWEDNEAHGKIDFKYASGGVNIAYSGGWENNKPHGRGNYRCTKQGEIQSIYSGNWINGKLHDDGINKSQITHRNQCCTDPIAGDFEWSSTTPIDTNYEGGVVNGLRHGDGVMTYTSGGKSVTYEGMFENDNITGPGRLIYTFGHYDCYYEGNFDSGLRFSVSEGGGETIGWNYKLGKMFRYVGGYRGRNFRGQGHLTYYSLHEDDDSFEGKYVSMEINADFHATDANGLFKKFRPNETLELSFEGTLKSSGGDWAPKEGSVTYYQNDGINRERVFNGTFNDGEPSRGETIWYGKDGKTILKTYSGYYYNGEPKTLYGGNMVFYEGGMPVEQKQANTRFSFS